MRFFRLSLYFRYFSSLSKSPRLFHIICLLPNIFIRGFTFISLFKRFVLANQLPNRVVKSQENAPEIELLVCSTAKDFWLLTDCLTYAVKNSINPISSVNVVVPSRDVELCSSLIEKGILGKDIKVSVIDEDSLIPKGAREMIYDQMGGSYGWALQQFLTVAFVCSSSAKGVLAVNSDTIILQPRLWLEPQGNQEFLVSAEFHKPYYKVIQKLDPGLSHFEFSFICHQMLFQPDFFRKILYNLNSPSISHFIELVLAKADISQRSPFCVEFELYGQMFLRKQPSNVILNRFANISVELSSDAQLRGQQLGHFENSGNYNSVSNHSWMG